MHSFVAFSKLRPVFYQAGFSAMRFLQPLYGDFAERIYSLMVKMES